MDRRADQIDETRLRIIEATVGLHGSVGPAQTTIAAIAREAGVTRATVYRHFVDDEVLFAACSDHWLSRQALPDPHSWATVPDPVDRLRLGLADLYRYYRAGAGMLTLVHRDRDALPPSLQAALVAADARFRDVLLEPFRVTRGYRTRLRGVLGHATSFETWRSLCVENALQNGEAVEAMTALVVGLFGRPTGPT